MIVPLPDWYPSMYDRWRKEGRRLRVPIDSRVGYTVHHTQGGWLSDPLSYAKWVANFHYTKWSRPGGYNFLIGTDGVIRAMCGWGFVGAHAPGCNYNRIGVAFQGTFATKLPNSKQLRAFSDLVSRNRVPDNQTGHRDCSSTTCPGSALYNELPLDVTTPEDDMPYRNWPQSDKDALADDVRRALLGGLPTDDNLWPDPSGGEPKYLATFIRRTRVNEQLLRAVLRELDEVAAASGVDVSALASELAGQLEVPAAGLTPSQVVDEFKRRL